MANKERWVFVEQQPQVLSRESADLAFKAGHQTGVEVRLLGLPGEEYKVYGGGHTTVPEGKVRIGVGRGNTGLEFQEWAERYESLKKVMGQIREEIQQRTRSG